MTLVACAYFQPQDGEHNETKHIKHILSSRFGFIPSV